ncbi:MAG: hypothetical protein WKF77_13890 [Planctomycetaceae bacterium]
MPRPPRADEAGGLYHALNRGNLRADIFKKDADFAAFEQILEPCEQKGSEQKGTFYFTLGLASVRLLRCHEHPEHLAVVLFTMS